MICTKCNDSFDIVATDSDMYICEFCFYIETNIDQILKSRVDA